MYSDSFCRTHYSKSPIFVEKFNFDKTPTFSQVFHPNFFWQFFSWNQSCQQLKSPKPQHFHEFLAQKNRQFVREIKVEFLDKKWRFRTVCRTLYNQVKYRTQKLSFTLPKDIPIFFLIVQVCQHFGKLPCISKSVEMRDDLITFLIFIAFSKKHKPRNVQITIKKIVLFFGKENRTLNRTICC